MSEWWYPYDDIRDAALGYAARACPVFPLVPRAKTPMTRGGYKAATLDGGKIKAWWAKWPMANIGMPTGPASGIDVLDIDPPDGETSLAKLTAQHGPLPETCEVRTGRGRQLWFKCSDARIRNSAGVLGAGLDIRSNGGYIVCPPSLHRNGKHYLFSNNVRPASMPEWLINLLLEVKAMAKPNKPDNRGEERIPEGQRNSKLTSIAGSLRRQGLPESEIRNALDGINSRQCDPPLLDADISHIAASVARYSPGAASSPCGVLRPEGFSLISLGELLARPEMPVDWVWQYHLAAGTVSGVFSKPKVGKSTFARNLCLAVARGINFLGFPVKKGLCVYLALEERLEDVTADFRAMGATGDEQILIHADAIPAMGIFALIGLVQERKPVLVVIDPLFRMIHVKDEKAYAETYSALGPLIDVARSVGTHVLVTHHMGKGMKIDPVDSPLGSTAIGGAVSSLIVLKRCENYRTAQTRQRFGRDLPETVLVFDPERRSLSLGVERSEADALGVGEEILRFLEGTGQAKTEPEITEAVEAKTRIVRRGLRQLVRQGKVTREGAGRKGNPYTYSKCLFPCSHTIPETREQKSKEGADNPMGAKIGNSFPCSHPLIGTREQESEKGGQASRNAELILVPTSEKKPILVPSMKEGEI